MKIILFNKILHTVYLPSRIDGSFQLLDIPNSEELLANIEEKDNSWTLNPVEKNYIIKNNMRSLSAKLEVDSFYVLASNERKKLLYVEDNVDTSYKIYSCPDSFVISVGKSSNNNICYNNDYLLSTHLTLTKNNNNWNCKLTQNAYVYINGIFFAGNNLNLKNGDVIFLYGLRIIIMNNIISINNPGNRVIINAMNLIEYKINQSSVNYGEVKDLPLYGENDYFFKPPRMRRFIETYNLAFARAPSISEPEEQPAILTVGPRLLMLGTSFFTFYNTFNSLINNKMTIIQAIPSIISIVAMLLGSFFWPYLTRRYTRKKRERENKKKEEKYHAYLEKKKNEMIAEGVNQSQILKENLMSLDDCYQTIVNKKRILWERKVSQKDFLTVRLGVGDVPMDMNINFNKDEFSIDEDPLNDEAYNLVEQYKKILQVPVGYSLYNKRVIAIMGLMDKFKPFVDSIILQLITYHSYDDLKIVILTDKKNEFRWKIFKNLPHLFSNNRDIRFFATDYDEYKNVSTYLEQEYIKRASANEESVKNEESSNGTTFSPYYLIFTDCFSKIRRIGISEFVLNNQTNFGFGFVIIENSLGKLPSECVDFISLGNQSSGVLSNELNNYYHQDFVDETNYNIDIEKCCEVLANIPIEFYEDVRFLPKSLGFLEMQKVGKVEQLNSLNRWRLNDPINSLRAAVGVNDQGNTIYLDLHEKYHGPHGLVAGTTGSGKSEFIITYVLSMALNYSPNEVSFILIDYKGGGLAGAFENKTKNLRLPHLAGTITNLDKAELNRTLVSIESELRRRQIKFNEARDKLGESTIDIYKYQKYFRQKKLTEPIPHLFIISDEFAELKQQQPEFMANLISTARIGRSLGVHLILATQKPAGVVNEEIWSNSKFRVCLKVQNAGDSSSMIKRPDAAMLKESGRFFLQVGSDELFVCGQSGWGGTQYVPSDTIVTEVDKSINYINNIAQSIKDYDGPEQKSKVSSYGDELSNVLKYICNLAEREKIFSPRLWLPNIPKDIYIESLIKKYNYVPEKFKLEAIIGEYDDPSNQKQDILKYELGSTGNTIIYGTSSANREMFLSALIYSICILHSTEEANIYIFDFGSETLRMFMKFPHVGDMAFISEEDKVSKLNKMITQEIEKRKKMFVDYNGDYENYCKNSGNTLPRKIFIYNNIESYRENYSGIDEFLIKVSRDCLRYGIIIIITAASNAGMANRLTRNFENTFVLDMPKKEDYISLIGRIGNVYPANYEGRGLYKDSLVCEYQTAKIYPIDNLNEYLKKKLADLNSKYPIKAEGIPTLPDRVSIEMMKEENITIDRVPIGIIKENLNKMYWNFDNDKGTLISTNDLIGCNYLICGLCNILKFIPNNKIAVIDSFNKVNYLKDKVDIYLSEKLKENIAAFNEKISNNEINFVIIIGIDKLKESVEIIDFNNLMKNIKNNESTKIIICETAFKLKKYTFETWFTDSINNYNGIWLGTGVMEQGVIRMSDLSARYRVAVNNSFAWVFRNGIGELVKCYIEGDNNNNNGGLNNEK